MKAIDFSNKWIRVAVHIFVWAAVITLPYLLASNHPGKIISRSENTDLIHLNFYSYFFWIGVFYLNGYWLIPRFFYTKRYVLYAVTLLAAFTAGVVVHTILFKSLISTIPFSWGGSILFNMPAFLLIVAASLAFRMMADRNANEKLQLHIKQENMKTELAFLRSQISPHFVFNVLNNIVSLVRIKSDDAESTVMKLSGLMQYMLYETDEEKVLLKDEADYLQSYIDLQQQRFGKKVKVHSQITLANDWLEIEPMLLIPFVENAFKHGVGMINEPEINIQLSVNSGNELQFFVQNKTNPGSQETKDKTSGIGLANVQRRLKLLYGVKHTLMIKNENNTFEISLKIKLR